MAGSNAAAAIRPGAGGVAEEHIKGFRRLRGFDPGRRGMPGVRYDLSPICRRAGAERLLGPAGRRLTARFQP